MDEIMLECSLIGHDDGNAQSYIYGSSIINSQLVDQLVNQLFKPQQLVKSDYNNSDNETRAIRAKRAPRVPRATKGRAAKCQTLQLLFQSVFIGFDFWAFGW